MIYNPINTTGFIVNPMTQAGDIIIGGVGGTPIRFGIGGANTVLHGGATAPTYSAVVEDDIFLSNVSTNNATVSQHGFLPVLSGSATQFLNGQGNFSTPAASAPNSYGAVTFTGTSQNVIHNFGAYPNVQVLNSSGAVIIPLSIVNNTLNDFTVTFSVSGTYTILYTVGSPQPQAVTTINSSTYTTLLTDRIITVTSAFATITLLTAVGNIGREFIVDNASTGDIYVVGTSGQTIEGETTQTIPVDDAINLYSTGSAWRIY